MLALIIIGRNNKIKNLIFFSNLSSLGIRTSVPGRELSALMCLNLLRKHLLFYSTAMEWVAIRGSNII